MSVFGIADDLLSLASTLLADPPARQFVTVGDIAVFPLCEQLAAGIHAPATSRGLGSSSPSPVVTCVIVPLWEVCVELWRCVPTPSDDGSPPSAADLNASAVSVSADAEDLFYGFVTAAIEGDLLDEACSLASLTFTTVGPTGGMVGIRGCVQFETSRPTGAGS